MNRNAAVLVFAWLALAATGATAQQAGQLARVDSILSASFQADGPGAAVAVVQDGRIILERTYGRAHLEYDVPITPATIFHVASVSKQFTTFAAALLAQQGRLSFDDDIRQHLPELHDFGHRITIRHLANHTSGIRDQWELLMMAGWRIDDVITRDQIMAMMLRQRELNFQPGAEYLYSNMGYTLLAEIVERVSGRTFNEFLTDEVFRPLAMTSTHVHNDHERVVPGRAYSYRPAQGGQGWRNAVLSYANQGATSLFTTAGDLARWLVNFETGQVGGTATIGAMRERGVLTSGDTIPYALAIQRGQYRGRTHWGHGGSDAGFRSHVVHFPEERLGVVVLSNSATTNAGALALGIADVFLGTDAVVAGPNPQPTLTSGQGLSQPPPQWEPSRDELAAFAGHFFSPELAAIYTIEVREDGLVAFPPRLGELRLTPGSEADAFRLGNRQARFIRDGGGAVTGFRLSGGRVRDVMFHRLGPGALPPLD
jgi:CubicO group peptidase (beta-lactamase class C family)